MKLIDPVDIGGRPVGPGQPAYLIAEAGVNHNGELDLALRLVDEAARAGADAVKFQAYQTDELILAQAPKARYQMETTQDSQSQKQMLQDLELSPEEHRRIQAHCRERGITYLCTPYDRGSADMLAAMEVAAIKIASTDTTNLPFLAYLARLDTPLILSTGMSTLAEIESAWRVITACQARPALILLQCTSEYPANVREVNLRVMETYAAAFSVPVGFSDHTPGTLASALSIARGACLVEKHFTLDKDLPGPDHRASLDVPELTEWVSQIRLTEAALGDGVKRIAPQEADNKSHMQKSLVTRSALGRGAVFGPDNLAVKRPGTGLDPSWYDKVIGRRAARDLEPDQMLGLADVSWDD